MKRRTFLRTAAGVAASTALPRFSIGKPGAAANSKLNIAFIGSGGWIARQPYEQGCGEENLVAFCDVDRNLSAENMKAWRTTQPFFDDFRVNHIHFQCDRWPAPLRAGIVGLRAKKEAPHCIGNQGAAGERRQRPF